MFGKQSVFLIGPMGSGKTAVGRALSRMLCMPFWDSDHEIERRSGADVPLIFEREGEAGFRRREHEAIEELTQRPGIVLSTGGGAVVDGSNRQALASRGWVVYLDTSVSQQTERAGRTRHRPMLHGADPARRLEELMRVREPLYLEIADLRVNTDRQRVHTVAEWIVREYRAAQNSRAAAACPPRPAPGS
jgi:shikimate kinase